MNSNAEELNNKPRTLKELSAAYDLTPYTMRSWLRFYHRQQKLSFDKPAIGYYYSIKQIEEIISVMGSPK